MIEVPEEVVKNLLEVIGDVVFHFESYDDDDDSYYLTRLREVKHDLENAAKTKKADS